MVGFDKICGALGDGVDAGLNMRAWKEWLIVTGMKASLISTRVDLRLESNSQKRWHRQPASSQHLLLYWIVVDEEALTADHARVMFKAAVFSGRSLLTCQIRVDNTGVGSLLPHRSSPGRAIPMRSHKLQESGKKQTVSAKQV